LPDADRLTSKNIALPATAAKEGDGGAGAVPVDAGGATDAVSVPPPPQAASVTEAASSTSRGNASIPPRETLRPIPLVEFIHLCPAHVAGYTCFDTKTNAIENDSYLQEAAIAVTGLLDTKAAVSIQCGLCAIRHCDGSGVRYPLPIEGISCIKPYAD
jgi:hypothetical protein